MALKLFQSINISVSFGRTTYLLPPYQHAFKYEKNRMLACVYECFESD